MIDKQDCTNCKYHYAAKLNPMPKICSECDPETNFNWEPRPVTKNVGLIQFTLLEGERLKCMGGGNHFIGPLEPVYAWQGNMFYCAKCWKVVSDPDIWK